MHRRDFIKTFSVAAGAALFSAHSFGADFKKFKMKFSPRLGFSFGTPTAGNDPFKLMQYFKNCGLLAVEGVCPINHSKKISQQDIEKQLQIGETAKKLPSDKVLEIKSAADALPLLQKIDIFQSLSDKGKISPNELKEHKKVHTRLKGIVSYINQISLLLNQYEEGNRFIATFGNKEIEFKLLHGYSLFQQYVSESANYFLHMSATILSKEQHCKCLGIDPDDAEYISCESRFPLYNRPIFYNPVGSMAFKDKRNTIPKMVKRIDELLTQYKNEKGIIHTVSYELTEAIMSGISNKNNWRLLIPRPNNRQEVLNHFYNSSDPLVLLSPSLTEGLDLKEDLSRFCIVCKMPYANTNDQWVKERQQEDQAWYATNTCTILMQMTGRVVRSEKDIASTYILDNCFNFLVAKYGYLFPKWWQDSVFSIEDEKIIKEKQINE